MEKMNNNILFNKRFFLALFFSWLIFIGIDFVAHASLLKYLWFSESNSLRSKEELFKYIPEGYLSFLLLCFLLVLGYRLIFTSDPGLKKTFSFGLITGFLFSLSQLLALHSFLLVSFNFLFIIYLVYWVEMISVVLVFTYIYWNHKNLKPILKILLLFFLLLITGIVLQNVI